MDEQEKKTVLQMLPYAAYLLTAKCSDSIAAAGVCWLTQVSFRPPQVVAALQEESQIYKLICKSRKFAVHILSEGQLSLGKRCFAEIEYDKSKIAGENYHISELGQVIIDDVRAYFECSFISATLCGDHALVRGELLNAKVMQQPMARRTDKGTLCLRHLGANYIYAG